MISLSVNHVPRTNWGIGVSVCSTSESDVTLCVRQVHCPLHQPSLGILRRMQHAPKLCLGFHEVEEPMQGLHMMFPLLIHVRMTYIKCL